MIAALCSKFNSSTVARRLLPTYGNSSWTQCNRLSTLNGLTRTGFLFRSPPNTQIMFPRRPLYNRRTGIRKRFRDNQQETLPSMFSPEGTPLYSKLSRAFMFTAGATGLICGATTIWQYENAKSLRKSLQNYGILGYYQQKSYQARNKISEWWSSLKDSEKMFYAIFAANALVFFAWRVPAAQHFMIKYFTVNLFSKPVCLPMILSTFSHQTPMHFLVNMYCLYTFSQFSATVLGKEQFLALYLCSGLFGSLGSYLFKTQQLSNSMTVGASAAILGLVANTSLLAPNAQFSIIFLPFIKFSAQYFLYGILAFDAAGIALGWRVMDHAAHLGGTLFGCWYTLYGHNLVVKNRDYFIEKWNKIRSS